MSKRSLKRNTDLYRIPVGSLKIRMVNKTEGKEDVSQPKIDMQLQINQNEWVKLQSQIPKVQKRDPYVWQPKHFDKNGQPIKDSKFYQSGVILFHNLKNKYGKNR